MPAFNDDEDSVLIFYSDKKALDLFTYSSDYHFSLLDNDEGVSLERIDFEVPTNDPDSWQSAASSVGFATPGLPNSQLQGNHEKKGEITIDPKVFFPDNTGQDDFARITYELNHVGSFANILVFNSQGIPVKILGENELLSTRGFVTWDGTTNSGQLAGVGYYIIWFEIFDANGNKEVMKETVVLGTRF
jgi:hypothetical protein